MSTSRFDRVRPRGVAADPVTGAQHDAQGKRALFSSAESKRPVSGGAIVLDCSRCGRATEFTPAAALRAAFPALHFSLVLARGDRETTFGLIRRRYGSWLRCPACGRGSWVRVTVRV